MRPLRGVASGMFAKLIARLGEQTPIAFRVTFADGSMHQNQPGAPQVTFTFRTQRAERRVLLYRHVGLLEAYFHGELDIDGDFQAAWRVGVESGFDREPDPLPIRLRNARHERRMSNASRARAKANARFHSGHGPDF
jgi:hypothetical protein